MNGMALLHVLHDERLKHPRVINRNRLSFAKISNLSSVSAESLSKAFVHHRYVLSISHRSQQLLLSLYSEDHELCLIQVKGGHSKVLFNIQRINAYHCQLLKTP